MSDNMNLSKIMILFALHLLCWTITADAVASTKNKDSFTMAILSAADQDSKAIADLLQVKLSAENRFKILERAELERIGAEKYLQKLLKSGVPEQNSEILNLMKTDILILITPEVINKKSAVKMVILERKYGLHLLTAVEPANDPEKCVDVFEKKIVQCMNNYSDGIKYIVGVTPFVSDNLTNRYDYLGATYKDIQESLLLSVKGLALYELDEVKTLSTESALDSIVSDRKVTTAVVFGTFKVLQKNIIRFRITIIKKNSKKIVIEKEVARENIPSFLSSVVGSIISSSNENGISFSKKDQFHYLLEKARESAELGLYRSASHLYEAALLLEPDDKKLTLALLDSYYHFYDRYERYPYNGLSSEEVKAVQKKMFTEILSANQRALEIITYMIENKKIDTEEAGLLLRRHRRLSSPVYRASSFFGQDQLEKSREFQFKIDKQLIPLLSTLPAPKNHSTSNLHNFYVELGNTYAKSLLRSVVYKHDKERTLYYFDYLFKPDRSGNAWSFIYQSKPSGEWEKITPEQFKLFLEELAKSRIETSRILGRTGLIYTEMNWSNEKLSPERKKELASSVKSDMKKWADIINKQTTSRGFLASDSIYRRLNSMLKDLTGKKKTTYHKKSKPADWRTNPKSWHKYGTPKMLGHLRFKKIMTDKRLNQCHFALGTGDKILLWNEYEIFGLNEKMKLIPIVTKKFKYSIYDVRYTENIIWVMHQSPSNKYRRAITTFDFKGGQLAVIDSKKLPDHTWSLKICAAPQNRMLLVGCLRPYFRTWFAELTVREGKIILKKFFEAKKIPEKTAPGDFSKETDIVFEPDFIHLVNMPKPQNDFIFVVRNKRCGEVISWDAPPLWINLNTLNVGILNKMNPIGQIFYQRDNFISYNGKVLKENGINTFKIQKDNKTLRLDVSQVKLQMPPIGYKSDFYHAFSDGNLFTDGKYFYPFAGTCYRIDIKTLKVENISLGRLPNQYRMDDLTYSKNSGIIGVKDGALYKVTIVDDICWSPTIK